MTPKILYVDDDDGLVRLAQKALGRQGFDVIHARDPETGRARLEEGDIDVIILDHFLQGTTGMSFLGGLGPYLHQVPVVYVTGSSEATIAIEALKAGAADYVIKTVGEEFWTLLVSAIKQALENSKLRQAQEAAELEIRAGKERAEILLAEVNHRVANSLALVAAMIRMQATSSKDDMVKAALSETQARITAIAGMHRSLYTSDDVRQVEMDRYLSTLATDIAASLAKSSRRSEIICRLEPIRMPSDRAVSVGMIVTELLTNAIKYAYPGDHVGDIRVTLETVGPGKALLAIEDDGVGFTPGASPEGTGLGSRIVASMARSVGDGIEYAPKDVGTRALVPLTL